MEQEQPKQQDAPKVGSVYKKLNQNQQFMSPIDKQKNRIEQQIFYVLMKIVQQYPQYTIAQHLAHVLRSKGKSDPHYTWSDENLLKHFEDYKDELENELSSKMTTDVEFLQ
jgi:hypothetical protein